jgi:hypothetical protein
VEAKECSKGREGDDVLCVLRKEKRRKQKESPRVSAFYMSDPKNKLRKEPAFSQRFTSLRDFEELLLVDSN